MELKLTKWNWPHPMSDIYPINISVKHNFLFCVLLSDGVYAGLQPFYLRWLRWTCTDDCKYVCMWKAVEAYEMDHSRVPQFFGKVFIIFNIPTFSILDYWEMFVTKSSDVGFELKLQLIGVCYNNNNNMWNSYSTLFS